MQLERAIVSQLLGSKAPLIPWEKHMGTRIDTRPHRLIVMLERALLGAAMSVTLSMVERRLSRRMKDRYDARP
ncbi:MAG: hypothetical protein JOZ19_13000 [Rubrobacter sp.]|nr:hypothetical protein [Rubrobacter sp.]